MWPKKDKTHKVDGYEVDTSLLLDDIHNCLYCKEGILGYDYCEHSDLNTKAHRTCCMKANGRETI